MKIIAYLFGCFLGMVLLNKLFGVTYELPKLADVVFFVYGLMAVVAAGSWGYIWYKRWKDGSI
jgi:hypothetical protein